jgi:hypothetical protein
VPSGWKRWLEKHCSPISVRTAQLYVQFARHRDVIEAEIKRVGPLSECEARRLIAKPRGPRNKPDPDAIVTAWRRSTKEQRASSLAKIPIAEFLAAMPHGWRKEIETPLHDVDVVEGAAKACSRAA